MAIALWKKKAINHGLFIRCAECGIEVDLLTKNHMKKHGLTKEEYIKRHPEHADIYFWGSVPSNKKSRLAHAKAGGKVEWRK